MNWIECAIPSRVAAYLEPGARCFRSSHLMALVSQIPLWHLSISHPHRYPTWNEIFDARYRLIPDEAMMAMILPPKASYVNIHESCFHLHELTDPEKKESER
jgi:hypothetical protein